MAKSLTVERRNKLAQIILSEGSVKVGDIAEVFHVSTETIRKDLIYLEDKGIVKKGHGGAIASSELLERPLAVKAFENIEVKSKIAQAAIELIPTNGVIILAPGSTTLSIAKMLTLKKGLTIITNSLIIAEIITGTDNNIFLVGGEIRKSSMAMVGFWASNLFSTVKADVAFVGTDGFESRSGPCTTSYAESEVNKVILNSCKKAVIVCDNSKFTSDGTFQFGSWEDIDYLITDSRAPEDKVEELNHLVEVIIAKG